VTLESVEKDAPPVAKNGTTEAAVKEEDFFEKRADLHIEGLGQDLRERKKYANRFFCMASAWLAWIVCLLFSQGTQSFFRLSSFHLSDVVVLAAIGATTVNVIGILYVVANYLFPTRIRIERRDNQNDNS